METHERDTYPPQITTIYSVWIPADRSNPDSYFKPFGDTLLDPQSAADLARRYSGEVRVLNV